jgi:uncharacterized paraquat-inducible protein A
MLKHLGFLLNLLAIALFIPGIIFPMFSLNMDVLAQISGANLSSVIIDKELSLLGTVTELWQHNRVFVAVLIFTFSIAIPVIKALLITIAYFIKNSMKEQKILNFVTAIGKWSMADVFVVAIFLAIMSTNHAETATHQQLVVFGFKLDLLISSETLSNVGQGFYYFVGYCLVSLIGSQISQYACIKQECAHQ